MVVTACEEMEHCHFFEEKNLIQRMRSVDDMRVETETVEDNEAIISEYLSFCTVILNTAAS